jgi:beta-lactamase regulating signal transducer with metallopeptidase domain
MSTVSNWLGAGGWTWLRDASVQLALLVGILWLLQPLYRRMPARFRHALWALVLLKALLPPTLGWMGGIGSWAVAPLWNQLRANGYVEASSFSDGGKDIAHPFAAVNTASSISTAAPSAAPGSVVNGLIVLWGLGVVVFAAIAFWRYRRLGRLIRESERIEEGPLRIEVERLASELGIANPPGLVLSPHISSPFLFGLFRGWIVLPAYLPQTLSPEETRHVLLHELMHWKRRDLWTGWLQLLVQALHWFHPLVWLANARLRHERECACDEAVLAHTGGESRPYAESIVKVLLESRGRPSMAPGILGIFERHSRLQHRLEALMNSHTNSRLTTRLGWAVIALFALVVLPMAPVAEQPAAPSADAPEVYVLAFKALEPFAPKGREELLEALCQQLPSDIKTHHHQASHVGGILFGYVATDGQVARDALQSMFAQSRTLTLVEVRKATPETMALLDAMEKSAQAPQPGPPRILSTSPAVGAMDVDPAVTEITITFDRDMGGGFSWTGGGPDYPKITEGKTPFWRDRRTAVLPVSLEVGKYYRVGVNSKSHQNFRGADGIPAPPSAIYFVTRGADEATRNRVRIPRIVEMIPPNGAADVSPALTELRITFDVPMGGGFSWTGGGPNFPTIPEGQRPYWTPDKKTAVLPVQLKPGWKYQLGLNSFSHKNFQSEGGIPLEPVGYSFATAGSAQ